ncbi:MAG TPA: phosphopyruvate hydratase [Bryobacteraceae bacterium]|nr:phosphopyruvate hydratase [Bryobacteraceae bacterium]
MTLTIRQLRALEILDSRGNPTLAVEAQLSDGTTAPAQVPSGASTGRHEAVELRDGDARYAGKGVRKAAANVNDILSAALEGADAEDRAALDRKMIELDGTSNKSRLGANAILGVSCAVARAVAQARKVPLWQSLAGARTAVLPVPMINILSGGWHAGHNIEFQDFLIIPHGFDNLAEALEASVAIHRQVFLLCRARGLTLTGVADEGGWGPLLSTNEEALQLLTEAIGSAGFEPREQVSIAIDVASSHFFSEGEYHLKTEGRRLTAAGMIALLRDWCVRYPVVSLEDPLHEDDWGNWPELTAALGGGRQVIGDDFLTTNPARVREAIQQKAANSVLVKMNQIGTLSETFEVLDEALAANWTAVVSARSGETEDSFLADLAVASASGQIKIGSITRSERLAKYNRLLEIEARWRLPYPGRELRFISR